MAEFSVFGLVKAALARVHQDWTSDYLFNLINYNYLRIKLGGAPRVPDLRNPRRFNDKIIRLKLCYRVPNANIIADKLAVRTFVEPRVGKDILIPLLASTANPDELDFNSLPNRFVAKPNHASGMMRFCDKSTYDQAELIRTMNAWLAVDYYRMGREYQYRGILPKILIERDMREVEGVASLTDYKFFCFSGKPRFVQIDVGRFNDHRRNFYDLE